MNGTEKDSLCGTEWRRIVSNDRTEKGCLLGYDGEGLYTRIGRRRISTRIGWRRIVYKDRTEKDII